MARAVEIWGAWEAELWVDLGYVGASLAGAYVVRGVLGALWDDWEGEGRLGVVWAGRERVAGGWGRAEGGLDDAVAVCIFGAALEAGAGCDADLGWERCCGEGRAGHAGRVGADYGAVVACRARVLVDP